jgi:hypothetical protein
VLGGRGPAIKAWLLFVCEPTNVKGKGGEVVILLAVCAPSSKSVNRAKPGAPGGGGGVKKGPREKYELALAG